MKARLWGAAVTVCLAALAACGKKGPPLAPLYLVPGPPADAKATRLGSEVQLRFTLPAANVNGPGVDLDRIEVFAVTLPPGATLATPVVTVAKYAVGTIRVRPLPAEGEPEKPPAPDDTRPAPGDAAVFSETLTADKLVPVSLPPPAPAPAAAAPTAAAPVARPGVPYPSRLYVVRGVSGSGRGGQVARLQVPLVVPPPPPASIVLTAGEAAVRISWPPVVADTAGGELKYYVYKTGAPAPLTSEPVAEAVFERPGVQFGVEECFVVRAVAVVEAVAVQGEPSRPECVTARDVFPPAAPRSLRTVAQAGSIELTWDASTEKDLGGYLVLRGEAPGDTLLPLTPAPVQETTFKDATVKPGVRYVYVVVAIDTATPPNRSAPSTRAEETAR